MSGFEVAGIVLGSIPLIVTAVEAYIKFMRDWGKIPSELKSLNRQLTTERAKLYNVLEQLLGDMVPQRDIEPMLQDPMGPLWQAKETNDKIRRMLWNSYAPFEETVLEIRDALENVMARLQVQVTSDGQATWVTKGRMTREFRKFLYRLDRQDYHDALATIAKGISDLESLARLSVRLEPARRGRSQGKVLSILRDLSTSIYRALCSTILCNDPHHVSLELTTRAIDVGYEDGDEKVLQDAQFMVAISFEAADGTEAASKRFWDEMSIKTATPPSLISPLPLSSSSCKAKKSKKGKAVSFSMIQTSMVQAFAAMGHPKPAPKFSVALASLTRDTTEMALIKPATTAGAVPDPTRSESPLVDLCTTLKTARGARPPCYGYLIDPEHKGIDRRFRVCPHGTAANTDTWSIVTLHDVLEQKTGLQPLTSLKDKIRLGHAIASSVLQLSKTPWLPEVPTSKNLHFIQRGPVLSYQHPFLLRTFPEQSPTGGAGTPSGVDRHGTLFALGIMLLEILLGSTLDRLREPCEETIAVAGDDRGVFRDSVTAFRLLEQRVALISPAYKVVVERCMECRMEQDLEVEGFRQEVYNGVVMELEAILEHTKLGT